MFVLVTGCRWRDLPLELGCGSGHTAWRRLREWQAAGVWDALHRRVLDELSDRGVLDWSRASVDGVSVRVGRVGAAHASEDQPARAATPSLPSPRHPLPAVTPRRTAWRARAISQHPGSSSDAGSPNCGPLGGWATAPGRCAGQRAWVAAGALAADCGSAPAHRPHAANAHTPIGRVR